MKLAAAAKTAALDVADAKKETNIIALRGAEVEKEMASVQVRLVGLLWARVRVWAKVRVPPAPYPRRSLLPPPHVGQLR